MDKFTIPQIHDKVHQLITIKKHYVNDNYMPNIILSDPTIIDKELNFAIEIIKEKDTFVNQAIIILFKLKKENLAERLKTGLETEAIRGVNTHVSRINFAKKLNNYLIHQNIDLDYIFYTNNKISIIINIDEKNHEFNKDALYLLINQIPINIGQALDNYISYLELILENI